MLPMPMVAKLLMTVWMKGLDHSLLVESDSSVTSAPIVYCSVRPSFRSMIPIATGFSRPVCIVHCFLGVWCAVHDVYVYANVIFYAAISDREPLLSPAALRIAVMRV